MTGAAPVASGPETVGHGGYIGSRCDLECPAHGKAERVYTSAAEPTAKSLLHPAEKKKSEKKRKTVENCRINTLRAAVSAQLFPAANVLTSGGLFQRGSSAFPPCSRTATATPRPDLLRKECKDLQESPQ